jgi:hypothetical protein
MNTTGLTGCYFFVPGDQNSIYSGQVVGDLGNQYYLIERDAMLPGGDRIVLKIHHLDEMRSWCFFRTKAERDIVERIDREMMREVVADDPDYPRRKQ